MFPLLVTVVWLLHAFRGGEDKLRLRSFGSGSIFAGRTPINRGYWAPLKAPARVTKRQRNRLSREPIWPEMVDARKAELKEY